MKAEILCVGTELLLGDTINTNAAFAAKELAKLGITVYHQSVVGDNPGRLKESLAEAFSRADIVLMTGGLGPTYDDLTKETVAEFFGRKMYMDEPSLAAIEAFFNKVGRPMTDNNRKQALMPEGAVIFANKNGTAPGLAVGNDEKIAILLPGPPNEMEPMMKNSVVPFLKGKTNTVIVSRTIHIIGLGESYVESILRDYMLAHTNPTIAPYAKTGEVQLRVTASAKNDEEAYALIDPVVAEVAEKFKDYVYGIDVGTLENAAITLLREKGLSAATAESCTGGMVSARLTAIAGASEVFGCGVCTYSNEMKMQLLGVREETLAAHGAVSPETALEMAKGVRKLSGADFGISITGIAGPGGGTAEKPVGLVYIAVDSEKYTKTEKLLLSRGRENERTMIRTLAANNALRLLIEAVTKY
ncbi:MAG: competence/damage-inducible protein A [Clostridiales bacterium]|nr:competence/damage-inducible protein A [Clostridiales bacterium]